MLATNYWTSKHGLAWVALAKIILSTRPTANLYDTGVGLMENQGVCGSSGILLNMDGQSWRDVSSDAENI